MISAVYSTVNKLNQPSYSALIPLKATSHSTFTCASIYSVKLKKDNNLK